MREYYSVFEPQSPPSRGSSKGMPGHGRAAWHVTAWLGGVAGGSAGHRVHNDVDRKARIVVALKTFVPPVVVPFAAVILVGVQHAEAAAMFDAAQIVVDEIVAPPVQLVRRLRRSIGEAEERVIEPVRV